MSASKTGRGSRPAVDGARRPPRRPVRARLAVTSRDVARLAGVSASAVSRTFTPEASVSERTRRKVLDAAASLGYQPNVIARSLITQRSRLIGLIMGEWGNPFYAAMLQGFSEKLQLRGYNVMLLAIGADGAADESVRLLMQYRVDGIVLVSCAPSEPVARECYAAGIRLTFINRDPGELDATGIVADNPRIGREVAQLLLDAGYTRIATVVGDQRLQTGMLRSAAFCEAIESSGRASVVLRQGGVLGYEAGRRFVRQAMQGDPRPDAIFCSSDLTAIGVIEGARLDLGLDVPASLGVVGLGDSPYAAWGGNDLTTVRLPVDRMIDASIEALMSEALPRGPRRVVIPAGLVRRGTVRLAPAGARR